MSAVILQVRFALEILLLIGAVWYIFIAMKEIYHQGFRVFFITLVSCNFTFEILYNILFIRKAVAHESTFTIHALTSSTKPSLQMYISVKLVNMDMICNRKYVIFFNLMFGAEICAVYKIR